MELDTILELVKAGFTKDEIMQLAQPSTPVTNPEPVQITMDLPLSETQPQPAQVDEPVAVAVPQPQPQPQPVPVQLQSVQPVQQPVQQPAQEQPSMNDLMQSIAKLTSAVQANAIAQRVIPGGIQNPPSAEDMLAEIIRPTYKRKEE